MKTYSGYAQKQILYILWGLILNHFHLNINGIDLLPDFVGFILFYLAVDGLALDLPEHGRLKGLAAGFAVIELVGFVLGILGAQFPLFVSVPITLAFAYFDYQLFTLVIDTAQIHRCVVRMESLRTVRKVRLVCNLLSAVAFLLTYRLPVAVTVVSIGMILMMVWSCIEVYGLWKELGEQRVEE